MLSECIFSAHIYCERANEKRPIINTDGVKGCTPTHQHTHRYRDTQKTVQSS